MKDDIQSTLKILAVLFLYCAILYNYSYWKAFDIQPYTYMSFSETIAHALPSIVFGFVSILGFVIPELLIPRKTGDSNKQHKGLITMAIIINIAVSVLGLLGYDFNIVLMFILVAFLYPISARIAKSTLCAELIKSDYLRLVVFISIFTFPVLSLTFSKLTIDGIKERTKYSIINNADIANDSSIRTSNESMIFIGQLGDYVFLLRDKSNSIIIMQFQNLKKLQLTEIKKNK